MEESAEAGHRRRRREALAAEGAPMRRPSFASSFVSLAEGSGANRAGGSGLSTRLESEEKPFDCVAFFNPTNFDEFEETVNGWADALLVLINSSIAAVQSPAGSSVARSR